MLLLDLSHTSHTHARTGVQRVCRSLHTALAASTAVTAITHDPHRNTWRPLAPWETANLASTAPSPKRSARWPLPARLAGRTARTLGLRPPALPAASALIVPEIFSATTASAFPALFARVRGPRIAIFHDAIALKFPELTPSKTVARFPAYLRELLAFDGIAANSEDSRQTLLDYWRWLGLTAPPPVAALPLALEKCHILRDTPSENQPPVVLSVGSIEGRKNHLALLDAAESLWSRGLRFELHLIGLAQPQTGRAALEKIRVLQSAGHPLRYDGPVDEAALNAAYARCAFTVYPSLYEGFGLPVLESLSHGKPCLCSAHGALGESTRDGGCLTLDRVDSVSLASGIEKLLTDSAARDALIAQARARTFRTWPDYARDLLAWLPTLPLHR
ncbi:glycosyl transferase family 1 [Nibricoccus aquaticus]|uniref:Glycosyl transferase family 1 n=1 Tax=Nibricoccus aquaticus TaxID=2576891 RepID=A0A290Q912_9BACT|nr:glycosyltransferase [Nibricoccus aquaticus]ATC64933.1 glycosyl transferase family 1 [Nibricoccus aquaticus]